MFKLIKVNQTIQQMSNTSATLNKHVVMIGDNFW